MTTAARIELVRAVAASLARDGWTPYRDYPEVALLRAHEMVREIETELGGPIGRLTTEKETT